MRLGKNETLFRWGVLFLLAGATGCNEAHTLFSKMTPDQTGIQFTNTITEDEAHNVFTYQYYYNGNGVAVGDVNGDGLTDVFFTGNQTPSKLFLNKGNLRFEDITAAAGVAGKPAWRTGANMVDVNGDGLLDIYVCYSGFGSEEDRAKQLFINKGKNTAGVPVFQESAKAYGLDAIGTYTSQSSFFDYDRDGDLDMFLLNHANEFYSPFFNTTRLRTLRHPQYGNRLYRNDNGHFKDVSPEAGIYGGGINFGLAISISDLNGDSWPDIFVSNDFHEQDYCYLNNRDGTFKEVSQQVFGHMSRNTMGMDIADYNNDLLPDVIALDMLPEDNYRQKILQGADEYDKYNLMVDSGYGHQNNRNVLQLHAGFTPDGLPVFSEIGQLAGVSNTDWSWAALFADLDNDGWKDLFITNGYLRESTNLDFMKFEVAAAMERAAASGLDIATPEGYAKNMPLYELVKKMPSTEIANYAFRNNRNLTFSNQTTTWGLEEKGVSSGATYADLDNDGDLDLIVCNNNDPVWVYRNNSEKASKNNYIRIALEGSEMNRYGIGAKVIVTGDSGQQVQEMYPVRGYQSSVDYVLNFGLGGQQKIKEVRVLWSADSATLIANPAINGLLKISKADAVKLDTAVAVARPLFAEAAGARILGFRHVENPYVDFKREFLIPYELSRQGPKMAKADVNGDGLEDVFIGGAAGQSGRLYLQNRGGSFLLPAKQPWENDAVSEDIGAHFFDADGDGDPDLYVVSGGNEWLLAGAELQDRLYMNNGGGSFVRHETALPAEGFSGSCVTSADYDRDGDLDLFVGARTTPGRYPFSVGNVILRNDGDAQGPRFTDVTGALAGPEFVRLGMATDAAWTDLDRDGWPDLVIVGDWMPVSIFYNIGGKVLKDQTASTGLERTGGFWCKVVPADVDKDGDTDLIVGNLGSNTQFRTSATQPLVTYVNDFNSDGKMDPIMTWYTQGRSFPFNSRDELVEQMPNLNKKFLKYADYATATIENIASPQQIADSKKYYIYETRSCVLLNNGRNYTVHPLPVEAQFSMASALLYRDFDGDGKDDLLLAGNFYPFRVQQGRCDANLGLLLKGNDKGAFVPLDRRVTGLYIPGDVRDMVELRGKGSSVIIVTKNNGNTQTLESKVAANTTSPVPGATKGLIKN